MRNFCRRTKLEILDAQIANATAILENLTAFRQSVLDDSVYVKNIIEKKAQRELELQSQSKGHKMFRIRFIGKWRNGKNLTYENFVPYDVVNCLSTAMWDGDCDKGNYCKKGKNLTTFQTILKDPLTKITTIVITWEDGKKLDAGFSADSTYYSGEASFGTP